MQTYRVPIRDMAFVIHEVLGAARQLEALHGDGSPDEADINLLMAAAAEFIEDVVFPLNQPGDRQGCRLLDGCVYTPEGYREAFKKYAAAGWLGLPHGREHGGQGAPNVITFMVHEMLNSACIAFADYVGCSNFIYRLVSDYAPAQLRERYGPGLTSGAVGAAMCLTEPQCGSDLRLIRTRAQALPGGEYAISGSKIFISGGDQDLTDDIIYLVLARLPDAPDGTRGLSLFLVPKWHAAQGGGRTRNGVQALKVEHKLGYAGSATCAMSFEAARGWMIGNENRGLSAMLTLVNSLRILVGGQGLSCAEPAYQSAAAYARNRLQGRAPGGSRHPERPADPLIVHPDVRKTLMGVRAFIEGARAAYYWASLLIDQSRSPDAGVSAAARGTLGLVTPVIKAVLSDFGADACNDCIQVFGGHGYVTDAGIHQYFRDVRIAQIQEGANGLLALDLVQRQLMNHGRAAFDDLLTRIRTSLDAPQPGQASRECADELAAAVTALDDLTRWLLERCAVSPEEAGAAGTEYQRVFGLVLLGWLWLRMVQTAERALARTPADRAFYEEKLLTARFFFQRILPQRHSLTIMARTGRDVVMAPAESYFG